MRSLFIIAITKVAILLVQLHQPSDHTIHRTIEGPFKVHHQIQNHCCARYYTPSSTSYFSGIQDINT